MLGRSPPMKKRMAKIEGFKTKLYENLVSGILTKEEFLSYKRKYNADIDLLKQAIAELNEKLTDVLEKPERAQPLDGPFYEVLHSGGFGPPGGGTAYT